jgi:hypothetical protein
MTGQQQTPFKVYRGSSDATKAYFDERYSIEFEPVSFDLDRVALALFASTYRSPITLLFPKEKTRESLVSDIAMTVELAHAIYGINEEDAPVAAAYETPEWYLRGMACFPDGSGMPHTAPVHVLLLVDSHGKPERAVVQVVCDPKLLTVGE